MKQKRIAVIISGNGSNLQSLIDNEIPQGNIELVISNVESAYGIERAKCAGIPCVVIEHQHYTSRHTFEAVVTEALEDYTIDLVALAGFMRILTDEFIRRYYGKLINIHPSLLPEYKGLDTHQRVLDAGETQHGATVHFVTPELDSGPAIVQGRITIPSAISADQLQQMVHQIEHKIYPLTMAYICSQRVGLHDNSVYLDGIALPTSGELHHFS